MIQIFLAYLHEIYKLQKADEWQVESIDFSHDYEDFQTLKTEEQYFIKLILSFFAGSDGIVNSNIGKNFLRVVTNREALKTYCYQMMIGSVPYHRNGQHGGFRHEPVYIFRKE